MREIAGTKGRRLFSWLRHNSVCVQREYSPDRTMIRSNNTFIDICTREAVLQIFANKNVVDSRTCSY